MPTTIKLRVKTMRLGMGTRTAPVIGTGTPLQAAPKKTTQTTRTTQKAAKRVKSGGVRGHAQGAKVVSTVIRGNVLPTAKGRRVKPTSTGEQGVFRMGRNTLRLPHRLDGRRRQRPIFDFGKLHGGIARELLHPLIPDLEDYDLTLSIIFGTFQRRNLLQGCVESIRAAVGNVSYEIIVCDGGSHDGSRQWLTDQPDCVLIEGDLSGAVPAFNACFNKAKGRYILTLNDDARLLDTTIKDALPEFDDPTVGQIACKFLEKGSWKRQQVHGMTYVNFGFVRSNLAKSIAGICGGLWATCYQTYGGDTELSCWVRRLGYKIVESDSKVMHHEHMDQLRSKNLRTDRKRGQFFHRWPSPEMLHFRGPLPNVTPTEAGALSTIESGQLQSGRSSRLGKADPKIGELPPTAPLWPERVVHMHLWTDEDPQASLAASMQALGSKGHHRIDWTRVGEMYERGRQLVEACAQQQPTFVFMQLQGNNVPVEAVQEIRRVVKDPGLVIASWSGDVGPGQGPWHGMRDTWAYAMAPHVDLMLFTGTGQVNLHRSRGMHNAAYLQIGYDIDRYFRASSPQPKSHDVVMLGQNYQAHFQQIPDNDVQARRDVVGAFQGSGLRFGLFGPNWGNAPVQHQTGAADTYRRSAMALSISVTSRLARYSSDRLIRSMATGCPTLVKRFDDMEGWGLKDKENCLVWEHPAQAVDLAREYLGKTEELEEIGIKGAQLMLKHHTWRYRITELSAILAALRGYR